MIAFEDKLLLTFSMLHFSSSRKRVRDLNGQSQMLGRKRCGAKRSRCYHGE
jgi:hypothetical protein